MSKWKITGITLVTLFIVGSVFINSPLMIPTVIYFLTPAESFDEQPSPEPPDYSKSEYWAALPSLQDASDIQPQGIPLAANAPNNVAVFFVHPTTYVMGEQWNQSLSDAEVNNRTDVAVMSNQTSVFQGCCDVYAPRYRQALLFSFDQMAKGEDGAKALALAYSDVAKAFEQFLEQNQDRPFILAAHSQGSHHLDRLMQQKVAGTELERRLIVAYPIGFPVDRSNGIPVCAAATQTGCQISWNTNAPGARLPILEPDSICVNPLTWRIDEQPASHEANLGSVASVRHGAVELGVVNAQCVGPELQVSEVRSENYGFMPFGDGNYHMYDYGFYYLNLRQNAQDRIDAFLAAKSTNVLSVAQDPAF